MSDVIYSPSVKSSTSSTGPGVSSSSVSSEVYGPPASLFYNSKKSSPNTSAVNEYLGGVNNLYRNNSISDLNEKLNRLNKLEKNQFNSLLNNFISTQRTYNSNLMNSVNKYNDSAYQRLVKDLKAAALNPMLATYNVSPNRISSVPYSNSIPNFESFQNDFNSVFEYFLALLNNANKIDLVNLEKVLEYNMFSENMANENRWRNKEFISSNIHNSIKDVSDLISAFNSFGFKFKFDKSKK